MSQKDHQVISFPRQMSAGQRRFLRIQRKRRSDLEKSIVTRIRVLEQQEKIEKVIFMSSMKNLFETNNLNELTLSQLESFQTFLGQKKNEK